MRMTSPKTHSTIEREGGDALRNLWAARPAVVPQSVVGAMIARRSDDKTGGVARRSIASIAGRPPPLPDRARHRGPSTDRRYTQDSERVIGELSVPSAALSNIHDSARVVLWGTHT